MDDAEGVRKQTFRDLLPKLKQMLNKKCSKGKSKATVKSFAINGTQPSLTEQYLLCDTVTIEAASRVSGRACRVSCIRVVDR